MSCSTTASIFAWNLVSVARASHVARARVRAAATATGSDSSIRGRTDEGRSKRLEKSREQPVARQHPPERCHTSEAELFTDEVFVALQAVSVTKNFVHAFKSLRLYESDWQANLFCEDIMRAVHRRRPLCRLRQHGGGARQARPRPQAAWPARRRAARPHEGRGLRRCARR